jgi:hypothetical protein
MGSVMCVDTEKPDFAKMYGTVYKKLCKALAKVIRQSNTWAEGLGIAHEKDNNILLQGIMTTAKLCCLCKNKCVLTLLWSGWWWKEWDNGHDNKGEILIFDDGYKTVYQCVCEVSAWLAINGVIVNVEKIMSVIVKMGNLKRCYCNFESILRDITKGFSVYNGSLGVIKNGKLKRCFCNFPL